MASVFLRFLCVHAGCSLGARKREMAFRSEADAGAAQVSSDPRCVRRAACAGERTCANCGLMDFSHRVLKTGKIRTFPEGGTLYERLGGRTGVSTLVKWFYAHVRFEPLLQPIFDAHITRWGPHLEVLTDFWCEQMGGPSHYTGSLARHGRLGLGPEHFEKWLEVWRANCRWLLPEPEAADVILLAERLAVAMREHAS